MNLGTMLAKIADTNGSEKEALKEEFLKKVDGHKEEVLLRECLKSADAGRKYISFGRNILPPEDLKREGFELRPGTYGFNYCFG